MPPRAIFGPSNKSNRTFTLIIPTEKMLFLNIGDKNISSTFWYFLLIISYWYEPIL